MTTTYIAERQIAPRDPQETTVLVNGQLLPSAPETSGSLILFDHEYSAMQAALKDAIGPERSRDSRHFDGDVHVVSYGAAFQSAEGGASSASAMFDAARGRGVLADGNGSTLAARAISHGFLRAMGRKKPEQLITSYDATEAVRKAAIDADVALGKTKSTLGEYYSGLSASFSGFQLLYQGRMAISHSGDTAVLVVGPDGLCKQATHGNDNQLGGVTSRRDARAAGPYGQNTVLDLKPGRNIVIVANKTAVAGKSAWGIGELIGELNLDPDNPDNGAIIASHIMDNGDKGRDGGVLAVVVDVDERTDQRSRLRKSLDPLRISTLAFGIMAKVTKPGIGRRALYDEPTKRGESWRRLSRAVDITTAAVGAAAAYNLSKHLEIDLGFITDNGVVDDLVRSFGSDTPDVPRGVNADAATQLLIPEIQEQPDNTLPGSLPAETADSYPDERTAYKDDPSTDRASNVSDWSVNAIEHYGRQEGLDQPAIESITSDWTTVAQVNQALYDDNKDVAEHALHYLIEGQGYDTSGQNDAARQVIIDWKAEHAPEALTPPPAEVPPAPPADTTGQITVDYPAGADTQTTAGNQNEYDHLMPVAAAIATTGLAIGAARFAAYRRKTRRLAEIAERESTGRARTHNRKYRKILDKQGGPRPDRTAPKPRPPKDSWEDLFSGVT